MSEPATVAYQAETNVASFGVVGTADDGTYTFARLRPGTYSLAEEQPGGYLDGAKIAIFEKIADQLPRLWPDHDRAGFGNIRRQTP